MNAGMERAMNYENLGAIIMGKRALDKKIWLWKLSGAKWSFQEVLGNSRFFGVVGCSWCKR
jgi:hypothetical protein